MVGRMLTVTQEAAVVAEPLVPLERALGCFGRVVGAVSVQQWALPTPCADWDVRQLVDHVTSGQRLFALVLRGVPFDEAVHRARDELGGPLSDDPASAFRISAADLLSAFGEPGVLERMVTVPAGTVPGAVAVHLRTTEALVHGWDLARACALPFEVPEDLAEGELVFSRPMLERIPPERLRFAPSRFVDDRAPAIDRLVALLGRDPVVVTRPERAGGAGRRSARP
jgi:uncharacterized protein (TIGR03086 family)